MSEFDGFEDTEPEKEEVLTERVAAGAVGELPPRDPGGSSWARSVSARKGCQAYSPRGTRCKICGEVHR